MTEKTFCEGVAALLEGLANVEKSLQAVAESLDTQGLFDEDEPWSTDTEELVRKWREKVR